MATGYNTYLVTIKFPAQTHSRTTHCCTPEWTWHLNHHSPNQEQSERSGIDIWETSQSPVECSYIPETHLRCRCEHRDVNHAHVWYIIDILQHKGVQKNTLGRPTVCTEGRKMKGKGKGVWETYEHMRKSLFWSGTAS